MKKRFLLVAVLLCIAMVFAGCTQTVDTTKDDTGTSTHKVITSSDIKDTENDAGKDAEKETDSDTENNVNDQVNQNSENQTGQENEGNNTDNTTGINSEGAGNAQTGNQQTGAALTDTELAAAYAAFENSLFIGDSRTEGLALYSGIPSADFFCAKSMTIDKIVSGNKVKVSGKDMSIYDILSSKTYSKVYIGMGLNELGWNHIEDFIEKYKELIDIVKEKQPDAKIYVEALLPVTQTKSDQGTIVNNGQIYWYNTNLVQVADDTGTVYVNADAPLIDEKGALLDDSTTDGIHLKPDYCRVWAKYLAEISQ